MSIWKCKCTIFLYRYYSIFELFFDPIFSFFEGILPYFTTTLIYNKCNLVCKNSLVKKVVQKKPIIFLRLFMSHFSKRNVAKQESKQTLSGKKTLLRNDRFMLDEMTQKNASIFVISLGIQQQLQVFSFQVTFFPNLYQSPPFLT